MQNAHNELSMVLTKLAGIIVCQKKFYKTLSIPKLLSWHIPHFDITTMLFGCFMGLLMCLLISISFELNMRNGVIS